MHFSPSQSALRSAAAAGAALVTTAFLTRSLDGYSRLLALAIALLVITCLSLRRVMGQQPEWGFLAVALVCGSLLSIALPRANNVSWDEGVHYRSSEYIALLLNRDTPSRPGRIPFSNSLEVQRSNDALVDSSYSKATEAASFRVLRYNHIAYLPSGLMLALGNALRLPHHIVYMLGRWINLVLYSFVVFSAIRKLKTGKMILSIIALFPTSIFLASVYNYDSWVTAFTMLGLACFFSELQQPDKQVSVAEQVVMLGAFVIGLGPKTIYFPLMFLLLFITPAKFNTPGQYRRYLSATLASILFVVGNFMLNVFYQGLGKGDPRGGAGVNAAEQVMFILSEPIAYAKILCHFIAGYIHPLNAEGYITFLAYVGHAKGFRFILAALAVAVLFDRNEFDRFSFKMNIRLGVAGAFLVSVALISTALYVSFTPVRSPEILGVQPRYLIPLAFPLLYVLGSVRLRLTLNRSAFNTAVFALMSSILLLGVWDLAISHYY